MPKAAELDIDLTEPAGLPPAATAPRKIKEQGREVPSKNDTPVNFRWPEAEVKAMKKAALEADQTIQDFMLSCFHSFLQRQKGR